MDTNEMNGRGAFRLSSIQCLFE